MGTGAVFSRTDFLDLGTTDNVGVILGRMQNAGKIRRIGRGLYELPRTHPVLGTLSPRPDAIVEAASRRSGSRYQPSGAQAANLLQLTEQVPARMIYQTDGASKTIKEGQRTIATERVLALRKLLSQSDRRRLIKDLRLAPAWMHPHLRRIASGEEDQ